jgi:hypothetical protein
MAPLLLYPGLPEALPPYPEVPAIPGVALLVPGPVAVPEPVAVPGPTVALLSGVVPAVPAAPLRPVPVWAKASSDVPAKNAVVKNANRNLLPIRFSPLTGSDEFRPASPAGMRRAGISAACALWPSYGENTGQPKPAHNFVIPQIRVSSDCSQVEKGQKKPARVSWPSRVLSS